MTQQNASKFAIFLEYKKPCSSFFFKFHFVLLYFSPNECPGLCWRRLGHSLGKTIKLHEMKNEKKYTGFRLFVYQKCGKFWSILLGHFIKHKPLISEECLPSCTLYTNIKEGHFWGYGVFPPRHTSRHGRMKKKFKSFIEYRCCVGKVNRFFSPKKIISNSLFRNKKFMLDEMAKRNASKFAIFLEYENSHSFFRFTFHAIFF